MYLLPGISVIICCFNSEKRIKKTLWHLSRQLLNDNLNWEVVLVNNASTDDTVAVASTYWHELGLPVPLRLIEEHKPGTDHARRAALMNAGFEFFVFCDDDNWLEHGYLQNAISYLQQHPNVGLIGGESNAVADIAIPEWFEKVAGYYAVGKPAYHEKDLTYFGLWGAGMAGRTVNMRKTMPANIPLILAGRVGNNTGFGEDGEMSMRMAMQGFRIMFVPSLKLTHFMAEHRLTTNYRDQLLAGAAPPAEVMSTYFRWLHTNSKNKLARMTLLLKQTAGWLLWYLSQRTQLKNRAGDFLYFLTGFSVFENKYNRVVAQYDRWLKVNPYD